MFKRLSIKASVFAAFGCLIVLLLATAALGQYGTRAGRSALKQTYSVQMTAAIALGDFKYNLAIARVTIDRGILSPVAPGSPESKVLLKKVRDYMSTAQSAYQRFLALPKTPDEQRLADAVSSDMDALVQSGINPTLQALEAGDTDKARDVTMNTTPKLSLALTQSSNKLNESLMSSGQSNYDDFLTRLNTVAIASALLLVVSAVFAVAAGLGVHRAIAVPLGKALAACRSIAHGDLSVKIDADRADEMGELMRGLAQMRDGLKDTVEEIVTSTASMAMATQEIAAGNRDLSRRTESQAAALEQTAASMEQMTATVKHNHESASVASDVAANAGNVARSGGELMVRVVQAMQQINAQSQQMASITSAIESIAFQTNILALNAAVEAARAGEQGRGFAVVATEVRTLAQRSAGAAKEIKALIDTATSQANDGAELVERAGATIREIVGSIEKVNGIIDSVTVASKEQADGIEQVSRAITQMDEVTQQNAALVEQTTAAAVSLEDQSRVLQQSASRFKV
ncbi:methyl-accepting chemotaxis protein [Pararobbsia alpina]|uniref:methyl-accepting chemotaxis protein n=1 Tax=Pararobbsia alpina TaxID=621374 RepID=UPI0039A6794D